MGPYMQMSASKPSRLARETREETENEKIERYERIISKLKKTLESLRRNIKGTRTSYQSELATKTELQDMLK